MVAITHLHNRWLTATAVKKTYWKSTCGKHTENCVSVCMSAALWEHKSVCTVCGDCFHPYGDSLFLFATTLSKCEKLEINIQFVSLHKLQHISDMICIVKYAIYLLWAPSEASFFGMMGMKHFCVAAIFHLGKKPPKKQQPWTGPKPLMDVFVMRL